MGALPSKVISAFATFIRLIADVPHVLQGTGGDHPHW